MNSYNGNQKGFIYAACDPARQDEVISKYLESLEKDGAAFCLYGGGSGAGALSRKEDGNIAKSNAVLLFLTRDFAADKGLRDIVSAAVSYGKSLLCVYLEDVELDSALSMQTESQQALFVNKYSSDEEFAEALKGSSIFENLQVTPEQKKAQKNRTLIAVMAAAVILIAAVAIIKPMLTSSANAETMEALGLSGLSKSELESIKKLSITEDDAGGTLSDLSGIEQLKNLEELRIEGQQVEDITPITKLSKLKALSLAGNPVSSLDGLEKLEDLESLDISETRVTELPEGLHVRVLNADASSLKKVPDFSGASYVEFHAGGGTRVTDVSNISTAASYSGFFMDCDSADLGSIVEGLKGIPVTGLALNGMQTRDLTELKAIDTGSVQSFGIGGGSMSSLDGIEAFENLYDLQMEYCDNLTDISVLNDMKYLRRVRLGHNMKPLASQLDERITVSYHD